MSLSRRKFVRQALWIGGAASATAATAGLVLNRKLNPHTPLEYELPRTGGVGATPTPECTEREPTEAVTEGPFYKPSTPERRSLRDAASVGAPLTVAGRVLSTDCRPVAGAVVDLWSCDGNGVYDTAIFALRGHQYTDSRGEFVFETVRPGDYRQYGIHRTPHIHVKVQGRGTRLLTTQLFLPGEPLNERDFFFHEELLVALTRGAGGELQATFDFVLASA